MLASPISGSFPYAVRRTLNQAARGSINPSEVALVLGYLVIGTLPLTLALSLFVACVSTLSKVRSMKASWP